MELFLRLVAHLGRRKVPGSCFRTGGHSIGVRGICHMTVGRGAVPRSGWWIVLCSRHGRAEGLFLRSWMRLRRRIIDLLIELVTSRRPTTGFERADVL